MLPILVVDDSREDMLLAERILRQCKIRNPIRTFSNGRDCIRHFEGKDQDPMEVPCLLLLDLMMAPVDGLAVLRFLKETNLAGDSPVVMVSGLTDIKAIQQGYQLGARTFLVKPINREDILQMLNSLKGLFIEETAEGYVLSVGKAPEGGRRTAADFPARISI